MLASIDWTNVLVALIAGLPAIIAAIYAREGHRQAAANGKALQTPSGDTVGHVIERTHDLAAVGVAAAVSTTGLDKRVHADSSMREAVERLNGDPESPLKVDGEHEEANT